MTNRKVKFTPLGGKKDESPASGMRRRNPGVTPTLWLPVRLFRFLPQMESHAPLRELSITESILVWCKDWKQSKSTCVLRHWWQINQGCEAQTIEVVPLPASSPGSMGSALLKRCHIENVADHHRCVCDTDQPWDSSVAKNNTHCDHPYKQRKEEWVNL